MYIHTLFRFFIVAILIEIVPKLFALNSECLQSIDCSCNPQYLKYGRKTHAYELCTQMRAENVFNGRTLDLSYLNITSNSSHLFSVLTCKNCVQILHLDNNKITDLQTNTFKSFPQLTFLYLGNNNITQVDLKTFSSIIRLKKLDISRNKLLIHRDLFVNNTELYYLNISFNVIELHGAVLNSVCINILDISYGNQRRHKSWEVLCEENFHYLPNLTVLNLEGNYIHHMQRDTFKNNKRLVEINLKNNLLKMLNYDMFNMNAKDILLKYIFFSQNRLICDCKMKSFSKWCNERKIEFDVISCYTPNANWTLLETLNCGNTTEMSTSITNTTFTTTELTTHSKKVTEHSHTEFTTSTLQSEHNTIQSRSISSVIVASVTTPVPAKVNDGFHSDQVLAVTLWYAFGAICCVITTALFTLTIVKIILWKKSKPEESSTNAAHYFYMKIMKDRSRYRDQESQRNDYIGLNTLHKFTKQKNSLYYSSCDVTNLPTLPAGQRLYESSSHGILQTDPDKKQEHIYETID